MFTGLIRTTGEIRRVDQRGDCILAIAMHEPFPAEIGDSIACSGICLTVIKIDGNVFKVSLSEETLRCTTARDWVVGTRLNLEPSLKVGDAMGGHFVSGHVDGVGRAIRSTPSGDSTVWEFEVPQPLAKFIAPKGSITVDGVSLTVNEVKDIRPNPVASPPQPAEELAPAGGFGLRSAARESFAAAAGEQKSITPPASVTTFTVNIIPHTAEVTGFKTLTVGDAVNLEIDMLARYVARLKESRI